MGDIAYKHVWVFNRQNRVLRFYLWAWKADPWQTTFCKMAWGYIFIVPNLFVRAIWILLKPVRWWGNKVKEAVESAERKAQTKPPPPKPEVPQRIADFFSRPGVRKVIKVLGIGVLILFALALLAGLAWVITKIPLATSVAVYWFLHTDAWIVATVIAGWVIFMTTALFLDNRYDFVERSKERKLRKRAAGEPLLRDVLVEGFKAIKANTCPLIQIRDQQ